MKFLKTVLIFLIFVFCFGFIAGFLNGSDINFGSLFPWESTEASTEDAIETSTSQPTESLTQEPTEEPTEDLTETPTQDSTESSSESTTEIPSDEVDFSKLSMNCLGDSVTAGGCGENNCSYVPALKEILGLNICRNYSRGGSPITDFKDYSFIDRYSSMDDDADIILVFGGFNDAGQKIGDINDTDTSTFYGALNTLVIGLREKYPDAYIFLIAPYKTFNRSLNQVVDESVVLSNGYTRLDYNVAIRAIGEKYNIDVLDLWNLNVDETSFIDAVHPTCDFANNVLAPTIAQFIKDNYKKPN